MKRIIFTLALSIAVSAVLLSLVLWMAFGGDCASMLRWEVKVSLLVMVAQLLMVALSVVLGVKGGKK